MTPAAMAALVAGLVLQGPWMWLGFATLATLAVAGDALLPDELSRPRYRHRWLLQGFLYLALPVIVLTLTVFAWTTGAGADDFLGLGRAVHALTGHDLLAARAATRPWHVLGALLGLGLGVAGYGTTVAHELTHRTRDPLALLAGRWLLGASLNADFAIEHVYGHHVQVGTVRDPATARRGEDVYAFALRSTVLGHASAWRLEAARLRRRGHGLLSLRNRMLTGYAISLAYAALFAAAGGVRGVALFVAQALLAKLVLEVVNYLEHYGLVRAEGRPVQPRHSWNTNRAMSSLMLFSLTRHSAHHEKGDLPYWELAPYEGAPLLPYGYLTTIFVALVPPVWHRLMAPRLLDWDVRHADEAERALARRQNAQSGLAALQRAAA